MTATITAIAFLVFALAILTFLLIGKGPLKGSKYLNFFRASCGVYVSGSVLVLVFTLIMRKSINWGYHLLVELSQVWVLLLVLLYTDWRPFFLAFEPKKDLFILVI